VAFFVKVKGKDPICESHPEPYPSCFVPTEVWSKGDGVIWSAPFDKLRTSLTEGGVSRACALQTAIGKGRSYGKQGSQEIVNIDCFTSCDIPPFYSEKKQGY
jgi:hypothetical protein